MGKFKKRRQMRQGKRETLRATIAGVGEEEEEDAFKNSLKTQIQLKVGRKFKQPLKNQTEKSLSKTVKYEGNHATEEDFILGISKNTVQNLKVARIDKGMPALWRTGIVEVELPQKKYKAAGKDQDKEKTDAKTSRTGEKEEIIE